MRFILSFLFSLLVVSSTANAQIFPNFPTIGRGQYSCGQNNGISDCTVPAGPPAITGIETILLDTNLPNGEQPQTALTTVDTLKNYINGGIGVVQSVTAGNNSITITPTTGHVIAICTTATNSITGCVKPDGTTVSISGGIISVINGSLLSNLGAYKTLCNPNGVSGPVQGCDAINAVAPLQVSGSNLSILNFSYPASDTVSGGSIAIGLGALSGQLTSAAYSNTAIGYQALSASLTTAGASNTAVGFQALQHNTTADGGTAFGLLSLNSNTTGVENSAFGDQALFSNVSGAHNMGIGFSALWSVVSGSNNVAIGHSAGTGPFGGAGTAFNNILIGYQVANALTSGANNVMIGYQAGLTATTATGNILIGSGIALAGATTNNSLNIGGILTGGIIGGAVIDIGGTAASTVTITGKVTATAGLQQKTIYSVAGTPLPTCNGAAEGTYASVSDATARATTYTGSSTIHVGVYCNGTNWLTL